VARFFNRMISENVQVFWAALQRGEFITDAAEAAGTYRKQGSRWVITNGGVRPRRGRNLQGRYLSLAEREEIALARAGGESIRAIAARLGRSPSTISRELSRNAESSGCYRPTAGRALVLPTVSCPRDGRAPRVNGRPQAGPEGTRSAVEAWASRPVPAPAAGPTRLHSTTSEQAARTAVFQRPIESAEHLSDGSRCQARYRGRTCSPLTDCK
jgi:hypothetical protein